MDALAPETGIDTQHGMYQVMLKRTICVEEQRLQINWKSAGSSYSYIHFLHLYRVLLPNDLAARLRAAMAGLETTSNAVYLYYLQPTVQKTDHTCKTSLCHVPASHCDWLL
jgi:hypothetical protein